MSVHTQSLTSPARAKPLQPSPPARTKLLLEGPVFPTLLRLAAPNVLNFIAFVGVITFDGFFLGRSAKRNVRELIFSLDRKHGPTA